MATTPQSTPSPQAIEKLVFACSGAADVGALTDQAARQLFRDNTARMLCAVGIGAGEQDMIARTRAAGRRLVIDGCSKNCAARCMEAAGIPDFLHINLEQMGREKGKSPVTPERIAKVVEQARILIEEAPA